MLLWQLNLLIAIAQAHGRGLGPLFVSGELDVLDSSGEVESLQASAQVEPLNT